MWLCTFKVTGRGHFPLDMLRYDVCHPQRQDDVSLLDESHRDPKFFTEVWTIELARYGLTKEDAGRVTTERWRSFGWSVVHNDFTPQLRKVG